jgi:hypothetical protein
MAWFPASITFGVEGEVVYLEPDHGVGSFRLVVEKRWPGGNGVTMTPVGQVRFITICPVFHPPKGGVVVKKSAEQVVTVKNSGNLIYQPPCRTGA